MYHGKRKALNESISKQDAKRSTKKRMTVLVLSTVILLTLCVGSTLAILVARDGSITNTFTPTQVSCHVTESFNGTTKSSVNVVNDSDIAVYIRVKLVTYRVNENGQHIGGSAVIPNFTLGNDWFKSGDYYYYSSPVAANASPAAPLIGESGISLTQQYTDADGGKQVIEVMAEAIQSAPDTAVKEAWPDVTVNNKVLGGVAG